MDRPRKKDSAIDQGAERKSRSRCGEGYVIFYSPIMSFPAFSSLGKGINLSQLASPYLRESRLTFVLSPQGEGAGQP